MTGLLWLVAVATVVAAIPSIALYAWPEAKRAGADHERWGRAMYIITRSSALAAVALLGALLSASGVVLGVAVASVLVQALDVAVAARRRKTREAIGAGALALLVLATVVIFLVTEPSSTEFIARQGPLSHAARCACGARFGW